MWRQVGKHQLHFRYDSRTPDHTKTSFSHDLQTARAPAYESMTEQSFQWIWGEKGGGRVVSLLQSEQEDSKWQSQSQCCYTEHFGRRRNKHRFLKLNQWCKKKKKKLKQNSIAELLGTSIDWFLATSSQPYQGFSCWRLETGSIKGRMLLLNHCWVLIVLKKGYTFIRQ